MTEALALRKEITVSRTPDEAFRIFTAEMGSWWPKVTHSVAGENARSVTLECRLGGRIFETANDGT